jgi:hypothetical protein
MRYKQTQKMYPWARTVHTKLSAPVDGEHCAGNDRMFDSRYRLKADFDIALKQSLRLNSRAAEGSPLE